MRTPASHSASPFSAPFLLACALVAETLLAPALLRASEPEPAYRSTIETWRAEREKRLKADGGWLTVAGLFWLEEGETPFGADPKLPIALPAGSVPGKAGVFLRKGSAVYVRLAPDVAATRDLAPLASGTDAELKPDSSGKLTTLRMGRLSMHVIERGGRLGIRLKDAESTYRKEFKGLAWYPIDEAMRVTAKWVPYDPPKKVPIPNVLGQVEEQSCPGRAVFEVDGREVSLEPIVEDPKEPELFFIFKDATAPKETYGAGRFLYAAMPRDGTVVLDFNKAYSPPCAFTPYATCPLPPKQNQLAIRIAAGEKFTATH